MAFWSRLLFDIEKINKDEYDKEIADFIRLVKENVPDDLKEEFTQFIINSVAENESEVQKIIEMVNKTNKGGAMLYETTREWKKMVRDEGRVEGRMEGKIEGKMEVAKNLLKDRVDVRVISRATKLSLNKIKSLQKEIA